MILGKVAPPPLNMANLTNKFSPAQIIQKINNWIDGRLHNLGIPESEFLRRKAWIIANFLSLLTVSLLTLLLIILHISYMVIFGYAIIFILILVAIAYTTVRRNLDWLGFVNQLYIIIATFIIILYLGGIPHSGGLIINGLTVILTAIILRNIKWLIWLTISYISTIIALALLQPYLTVPEDWTSSLNLLFFVLNIVWMTIYLTIVLIQHIRFRTQTEENEKKRLMELDEAKTRLYTNITHEFRTPLTVILGMTDQMETDPKLWTNKGINKIRQNSYELLRLVNTTLDLAKMQSKAMPVNYIQGNIVLFLRYIVESFHETAENKEIRLFLQAKDQEILMDYDSGKISSIFSNLISNALKFTPNHGEVTLTVAADEEQKLLQVEVRDNGAGIPPDKLPHIFDRFYQVNENSIHHSGGSGLGLALVKELVQILEGEIRVTSNPGQGTVFQITLPISNQAELIPGVVPQQLSEGYSNTIHAFQEFLNDPGQEENLSDLLLIVEDNADVVKYLYSLLEKEYRIEVAQNGEIALEKAVKQVPDLIISDVMMPVMDGFTLLKKVKDDMRTSHIPVLLLTAKADMASRLEGLGKGADAYLTKPFNKDELFIRIRKLVESRKILRERYASFRLPGDDPDATFNSEDRFMKKVQEILNENLTNEDFTISHLCASLFMSRTQFYRKFKALSDKTVSAYFRSLRLYRAKELLQTSNLNITQVAFEVGFKDLSHFSFAFKKEYGMSPSELK